MNIGDKAPEVLGINEKGVEIRLSDYKGKKIVLYFYPKDMTSGCTAQACNLRDNYADLRTGKKTRASSAGRNPAMSSATSASGTSRLKNGTTSRFITVERGATW